MGTLIVGLVFAAGIAWAATRAHADLKKGSCSGCTGCSTAKGTISCPMKED